MLYDPYKYSQRTDRNQRITVLKIYFFMIPCRKGSVTGQPDIDQPHDQNNSEAGFRPQIIVFTELPHNISQNKITEIAGITYHWYHICKFHVCQCQNIIKCQKKHPQKEEVLHQAPGHLFKQKLEKRQCNIHPQNRI